MKAYDVQRAIIDLPGSHEDWDLALFKVLPILRKLAEAAKGWKFWLGWGMAALIGAVEGYLRSRGYQL